MTNKRTKRDRPSLSETTWSYANLTPRQLEEAYRLSMLAVMYESSAIGIGIALDESADRNEAEQQQKGSDELAKD